MPPAATASAQFFNLVTTPEQLAEAVAHIRQSPAYVFDVETSGPDRDFPILARVSWISFAIPGAVYVIPIDHPNGNNLIERAKRRKNKETGQFELLPPVYDSPPEHLSSAQVWPVLKPLFHSEQTKVAHNALFDLKCVVKYVGRPLTPFGDTLVAHWLEWNDHKKFGRNGLKEIVSTHYGQTWEGEVGKKVEDEPFDRVAKYSATDSFWTWVLWDKYSRLFRQSDRSKVFGLEMQVIEVVLDMELHGVYLDRERVKELDQELTTRIVNLEREAHAIVGRPFSLASNPEKVQILYKERGLKPHRTTPKGAPSVDRQALERHRGQDPLVDVLLKHSEVTKLHTTYVTPYLSGERIVDGRLHPEFVQSGTTTGRFSSRSPNVQNIPRPDEDKEYSTAIRSLFRAPPGRVLVVADWSQIEYRLLASLSKEPALVEAYQNGLDAHTATAATLYGKAPEDVTKHERAVAKGGNFATVYGSGPATLAQSTGVSLKEAGQFLRDFEASMPMVARWKNRIVLDASEPDVLGVETKGKRFRHLEDLENGEEWIREAAARKAVNTVIQGTAADLMKEALLDVDWELGKTVPTAFLVLTVHDELVVECDEGDAQKVLDIVKAVMESPTLGAYYCPGVPLVADVKVVTRWSEAK